MPPHLFYPCIRAGTEQSFVTSKRDSVHHIYQPLHVHLFRHNGFYNAPLYPHLADRKPLWERETADIMSLKKIRSKTRDWSGWVFFFCLFLHCYFNLLESCWATLKELIFFSNIISMDSICDMLYITTRNSFTL